MTTSPAGTAQLNAGVLGGPTTTLFGGDVVNDDIRSGFRVGAGYWFNAERTIGIEAGFLLWRVRRPASRPPPRTGPRSSLVPF